MLLNLILIRCKIVLLYAHDKGKTKPDYGKTSVLVIGFIYEFDAIKNDKEEDGPRFQSRDNFLIFRYFRFQSIKKSLSIKAFLTFGADEGNRTPVSALARLCSTVELHLHGGPEGT